MKKTMMIAASLAVLAGCAKVEAPQQEATQEENGVQVITAFVKENATKVAISSDDNTLFDHKWQAGDEISLFDNGTYRQYTLKTGAGECSATFSGATLSETTPYYALYPYNSEATIAGSTITTTFPAVQTYTAGGYDPAALVMIAQSADANSFGFKLASSILQITLTPTSDYTVKTVEITANGGESIAGTGNVDWNEGNPTVTMTSGVPTVTVSFGAGVYLYDGTPYTFYVALPAVTLSSGVSVAVTGSDNKMLLKKSSTLALTRNYVTKMHALTAVPNVTNLSLANSASAGLATPETANCYLVTTDEVGTYAIPIDTKGNSSEITLKGITSVEKLWDDGIGGNILADDSTFKLYGKYLVFSTTGKEGNALVAAKKSSDIQWSWHIWVHPTYTLAKSNDVKVTHLEKDYYFMPINVGASSSTVEGADTDSDECKNKGCLYQWGRKDPLTTRSPVELGPGSTAAETVAWSIQNPTTFDQSWLMTSDEETLTAAQDLWSSDASHGYSAVVKTIYDPSPVGYSVMSVTAAYAAKTAYGTLNLYRMDISGCQLPTYSKPNDGKTGDLFAWYAVQTAGLIVDGSVGIGYAWRQTTVQVNNTKNAIGVRSIRTY